MLREGDGWGREAGAAGTGLAFGSCRPSRAPTGGKALAPRDLSLSLALAPPLAAHLPLRKGVMSLQCSAVTIWLGQQEAEGGDEDGSRVVGALPRTRAQSLIVGESILRAEG